MNTPSTAGGDADPLGAPPSAYQQLAATLGATGWISHGSVVRRTLRRRVAGRWINKGPYYYWTCKVAGQTHCQALSKEQYHRLGQAVAAQRRLRRVLARMQRMTFEAILKKIPGVDQRK